MVLLAQLAAVLPRDADRVLALLGEPGVIDDRGLDRASASIFGSAIWRTLVNTASSDQGAMRPKCSNDWQILRRYTASLPANPKVHQ
jgi:hypothetical protein